MEKLNKRWVQGGNSIIAVVLAFILLVLVNVLAVRFDKHWDVSKAQLYKLTDKSHQVLQQVQEPLDVVVFFSKQHPLFPKIKNILENYQQLSDKVRVTYVDPLRDPAQTKLLAERYQVEAEETVVVSYKDRHKQLHTADLADYDYRGIYQGLPPQLKNFQGEQAITGAVLYLCEDKPVHISFVAGHGERGLEESGENGLTQLKKILIGENATVDTVTLLGLEKLPEHINLLVLAGPTVALLPEELALVKDYVDKGGRLLCLVDPMQKTGLEDMLFSWGIVLGDDVVVDPARSLPGVSPANVFVMEYGDHPSVKRMGQVATLLFLVRSVGIHSAEEASPWKVTSLAKTSKDGWGEKNYTQSPFEFQEGQDLDGPVSVAVSAEHETSKSRVVVIGDSDHVTNGHLANLGNKDFFMNVLNGMLERENLVSIPAKETKAIQLQVTASQMVFLFWVFVIGLPLLWLVAGVVVWWVRRR